jgi:hypothetical protein
MKKILITLLTLFTALTFNNVVVAEDSGYVYRCRISYNRVNENTNKIKRNYKVTTQFYNEKYCKAGRKKLSPKIIKWMSKDVNNMVDGLSSRLECKNRGDWSWGRYHDCKPNFIIGLIEDLKEAYPNQVNIPDPE